MAIMFFNREIINRSNGRRVVSTAAWRHSATMRDIVWGETYSFKGRSPVPVHEEIVLPVGAPEWAVQRYGGDVVAKASEMLWNDVEVRENQHKRRAQAQLAQSYTVALPRELNLERNVELVRAFVGAHLVAEGATADLVLHENGNGNPACCMGQNLCAVAPFPQ